MMQSFNSWRVSVAVFAALGLGGCSNLLYSDTSAPIYSGTKSKQSAPSVLNSSVTPLPTNSRGSVPAPVESIERPATSGTGMTVNNHQNNPYGTPTRPTAVNSSTAIPAATSSATIPTNPEATALPTATAASTAAAVANPASEVPNDPRIKEGRSVLNTQSAVHTATASTANPVSTATAARPSAVLDAAKNHVPANAPTTPDNSAVSHADTKVKTTAQQGANTAATQTSSATKQAATAATQSSAAKAPTATTALLQEARGAVAAGNYDKAASALERAHRIEPGNAKILYDIAQIRYAQGKYRQAASFASKAANYSGSKTLSKKIWTLLSNSRRALGNTSGADSAAKKAATF